MSGPGDGATNRSPPLADRLEQSLLVSTATKLAADARLQVEENATRALLLAAESVEMTEKRGVLPEAASSMMDVLQKVGGLDATPGGLQNEYNDAYIATHPSTVHTAQASPDGRWLLTVHLSVAGTRAVTASIFDLTDRERSRPLRTWDIWPQQEHGEWQQCCWTADSKQIVAVRMDKDAAALLGIDIRKVYAITFGIGAAMAGACGVLFAMTFPVSTSATGLILGKAFVVCVIGGLGTVGGALFGGLVLGLVESIATQLFGPQDATTIGFVLMLVLLMTRPTGLLGRAGYE